MSWQFFVTFFGWLCDPFQWLSDLQLGDEKVTLNHLGIVFLKYLFFWMAVFRHLSKGGFFSVNKFEEDVSVKQKKHPEPGLTNVSNWG